MKPFIKWAGGKTQLLTEINFNLDRCNCDKYIEPFVGAGAVFFDFAQKNMFDEYIINDLNTDLINVYKMIKTSSDKLIVSMKFIQNIYNNLSTIDEKKDFFLNMRKIYNSRNVEDYEHAALFIFLNKTCFNGLYRVNSKGDFNVPFGQREKINIFDEENILEISKFLNTKEVKILNLEYHQLEKFISSNTFVYFDPPYRPITVGGFNSYDKTGFNDTNQEDLADFYSQMDEKGAKLMLSNSDPMQQSDEVPGDKEFFDKLYSKFNIKRVNAKRAINSKGKGRGSVTELLIINYDK